MKKNKNISKILAGFLSSVLVFTAIPMAYQIVQAESNTGNIAGAATIEAETPGWVQEYMKFWTLVDGKKGELDGYYTSEFATDKNTTKTIMFSYGERAAYVEKITLYPRVENGKVLGFPETFHIELWNGHKWDNVGPFSGYTDVSGPVEIPVDKAGNSIKIVVDVLGKSKREDLPYCLQLSEIEVFGFFTSDTLLLPDSELASYSNDIALNATKIEAETVDWASDKGPENLNDGNIDGDLGTGAYGYFYTSEYVKDSKVEKGITFVFDKDCRIEGVMLYPRVRPEKSYNGFPKSFKVEILDSRGEVVHTVEGTSVPDGNGYVGDSKKVDFAEAVAGRSVRIMATELGNADNSEDFALQLAEVAIFGTANIALNAAVLAEEPGWASDWWYKPTVLNNGNAYDTAAYISDGTTEKRTEKTIEFQFAAEYSMDGIVLYPGMEEKNNGFPAEFKIEIYNGTEWKQVARGTSSADENECVKEPVMVAFDATCGNRLKITATELRYFDNSNNYGLRLAEVDIFGTEVLAAETYYDLDAEGNYSVVGKTLAKDGKVYQSGDNINIPGDYTAIVAAYKKAVDQKIYIWKAGDAHPDSNIDSLDIVALKKAVSGDKVPATKSGEKSCDVDKNGKIEENDCKVLREVLLGSFL